MRLPYKRTFVALDAQQTGQHFGFGLLTLAVVQCVRVIGRFIDQRIDPVYHHVSECPCAECNRIGCLSEGDGGRRLDVQDL